LIFINSKSIRVQSGGRMAP